MKPAAVASLAVSDGRWLFARSVVRPACDNGATMAMQRVTAKRLWTGKAFIENPEIRIEAGRITGIESRAKASSEDSFPEATLGPGYLDVHFHGAAGHDVMEATPEALRTIGEFLATQGTAQYLATTVTASLEATLKALDGLAGLIERPEKLAGGKAQARPVGIHLEGPFLSQAKCGVQPKEHILKPDVAVFERMLEAGRGTIRLMTVAPEEPGAEELIRFAISKGVQISLGHTNGLAEDARRCIAAGARNATHTFNAMRPFEHREPGVLGEMLTNDSVFAELICDGVHVASAAVKLWWRAKGPDRAILITDAMSAAGMPDGNYTLGGFPVEVAGGKAMARGVLAGSTLTQARALENFLKFTGARLEDGLRLLTRNPAELVGLEAQVGSVAAGAVADLVAVNPAGHLVGSVVAGVSA